METWKHGNMEEQATESLLARDEVARVVSSVHLSGHFTVRSSFLRVRPSVKVSLLVGPLHDLRNRLNTFLGVSEGGQLIPLAAKCRSIRCLKELIVLALTTSAGRLFQCRSTRLEKKLRPMSVKHLFSFNGRPLLRVLELVWSSKSLLWLTLLNLFRYLNTSIMSPLRRLFSSVKRLSRLRRSS